jgi:membrane protein
VHGLGLSVSNGVRRLLSDLARVELIDRSLALGAQALLALIPMLMALGAFAPATWGTGLLAQLRDVVGVGNDVIEPLREAAVREGVARPETGLVGVLVALVSASSFSRALQRMYTRAWELSNDRGVRALRSSLLWLLGWVAVLQATALLLRSLTGTPVTGAIRLTVQLVVYTLLWWWTSRLLLGGRVSWGRLLPGAAITSALLVVLSRLSSVFMPPYTRANLEQYGPLGVVFSIGSWLVMLGGVLVVATVIGRLVSEWRWGPVDGARAQEEARGAAHVAGTSAPPS